MPNAGTPEDTGRNQARQFTRSGNVSGGPRGSKSKTTLAAEGLMQGQAEGITRKCIEMAWSSDTVAMRLVLDRILPIRKARVRLDLPELRAASDIVEALGAVAKAGAVSPKAAELRRKVMG